MTWDITGTGAVANLGATPAEIFDALCAGTDGRSPLQAFDASRYRAPNAYEIDDRSMPGRDESFRATRWLEDAVRQAMACADIEDDVGSVPVLVGTTMREQRSAELWWRDGAELNVEDLHFDKALRSACDLAATYTFANACAAALCSLGLAADLIELDMADTVVVAGTDSITESAFGMLDRVQGQTPEALRPFDRSHKGMLMGEGAVAIVLQRTGTGSAEVQARLRGVAMSCDAAHPTAPDPAGIAAVVRDAHRRAGVQRQDIDLVLLHGSGTPRNDETEASVLADIFGGSDPEPLMTAIKSMTGHTLGGSGLLSLVMGVQALQRGVVPPILGLVDPIPEAAGLQLVRDRPATADLVTAQVDAFGFGGINAVAIVEGAV